MCFQQVQLYLRPTQSRASAMSQYPCPSRHNLHCAPVCMQHFWTWLVAGAHAYACSSVDVGGVVGYLTDWPDCLSVLLMLLLLHHHYHDPTGKVLLLTNPVVGGYVQNPISVYYCYSAAGKLAKCIAEVRSVGRSRRVSAHPLIDRVMHTIQPPLHTHAHMQSNRQMGFSGRWLMLVVVVGQLQLM